MDSSVTLLEPALRLLLAMCIGGCIGWERANTHHPAGIRTHMLVTIGATVVMLLGSRTAGAFSGMVNSDPARLGAQVISGIGFLGAGTIMKEGRSVRGLTTAATLWVAACLGLAVGAGEYAISIGGALMAMIALRIFKFPRFDVSFVCESGKDRFAEICHTLELEHANINDFSSREMDETRIRVQFALYLRCNQRKISTASLLKALSSIESVSNIRINCI